MQLNDLWKRSCIKCSYAEHPPFAKHLSELCATSNNSQPCTSTAPDAVVETLPANTRPVGFAMHAARKDKAEWKQKPNKSLSATALHANVVTTTPTIPEHTVSSATASCASLEDKCDEPSSVGSSCTSSNAKPPWATSTGVTAIRSMKCRPPVPASSK